MAEGAHHHWIKARQRDVFLTWHIVPIDDTLRYHEAEDCPCGPATKPVPQEDGGVGWLIQHFALDGRELPDGTPGKPVPTSEEGSS